MYRTTPAGSPWVISVFDGAVAAYERSTGRTAWVHRGPPESDGSLSVRPVEALVDSDRVFVLRALHKKTGALSEAMVFEVCALAYLTGAELWRHVLDRSQSPGAAATMVADGDHVFVVHHDAIVCIAADSGAVQWLRQTERGEDGNALPTVGLLLPGATSRPIA